MNRPNGLLKLQTKQKVSVTHKVRKKEVPYRTGTSDMGIRVRYPLQKRELSGYVEFPIG